MSGSPRFLLVLICCLLAPIAAGQRITADALRSMDKDTLQADREKARRVGEGYFGGLLDQIAPVTQAVVPDKPKPKPVKQAAAPTTTPQINKDQSPQQRGTSSGGVVKVYRNHATGISSDVVLPKQTRFGIYRGTWIDGAMMRPATNSDPGQVEIVLTADVEGKSKVLPSGTKLFADKRFNQGTNRLDLIVNAALLPDGREIQISAIVYDRHDVAGLVGSIQSNDQSALAQGFNEGLVNAGSAFVRGLVSDPVGSALIGTTANAVASNQRSVLRAERVAAFTINVPAQSLRLQITKSF